MPRPTSRRLLTALLLVAAGTAAGAAPAAGAPAVAVLNRCYVSVPAVGSQPIDLALTGLAAGQQVRVQIEVSGKTVSGLPSLTADATGSVVTQVESWTSGLRDGPTHSTPARVVVFDVTTGAELAETPLLVANVAFSFDGTAKRAATKRRFTISGLSRLGGGHVYWAFYFKGKRLVGKQRLGRVTGACGYLQTRKLLLPFKGYGTFTMRILASRHYRTSLLPLEATITSYRTTG